MELQLLVNALAVAATIGILSYTIISIAWCALLVATINQIGRPIRLRDEPSVVITLGVAFHAVCWPYSMKTVYDRHRRRRESLARSKK